MYLLISEHCAWGRETWHYLLDIDKQDSQTLQHLFTFMRLANLHYVKAQETAAISSTLLFTESNYTFNFYAKREVSAKRGVYFIHSKGGRFFPNDRRSGYILHNFDLDNIISPRRMLTVMRAIVGKEPKNRIYKNFEYLFLSASSKRQLKPVNA